MTTGFDEEPAPLHGECAAEIQRITAERDQLRARVVELLDVDAGLRGAVADLQTQFTEAQKRIAELEADIMHEHYASGRPRARDALAKPRSGQ